VAALIDTKLHILIDATLAQLQEFFPYASFICLYGTGKLHTGFCLGDLMEKDYLNDLDIDGRIILKLIFKE
jgi:hypothetical protein